MTDNITREHNLSIEDLGLFLADIDAQFPGTLTYDAWNPGCKISGNVMEFLIIPNTPENETIIDDALNNYGNANLGNSGNNGP